MSFMNSLIIFACLIASSSATVPLAKSNCPETCGSVTIPYPFGIGVPSCYLSPDFEITCNSSNRAFLRKFNIEVLDISLDTHAPLLVSNPVYSPCTYGNSWNSTDLTGSHFSFDDSNAFLNVGCENARMIDQRNKVLASCTPSCLDISPNPKDCFGINCCQTAIPTPLQFYKLRSTLIKDWECTYAFLAREEWLAENFSSILIKTQHHAPVILKWGINRSEFPGGIDHDHSYHCYSAGIEDLHNCDCSHSYEGNAYIINGCRVVSTCTNCNGRCEQDLEGMFHCIPNKTIKIIIAGTLGGAAVIGILIIFGFRLYKIIKRRQNLKLRRNFFKRNGGLLLIQQLSANEDSVDTLKIFTVKELEKATDGFNIDRILGRGGQATVYKGVQTDGKIVAVKKSTLVGEGQVKQFINEVVILSRINHRNIVKLLGCCLESEVPLLVYEFIPNGTLSQLIRNQDAESPLSWELRLQIASDVSGALSYLHSATSSPIYHRDIKSSNILLDDKYNAKVADFGTSRSVAMDQTHVTTTVQGTFGYLDPEFFQSGQFTDKSDVYGFGVVLAELLTGERPIMSQAGQEEKKSLATHFVSASEKDLLFEIIDERVAREGNKDEVTALAVLARRCLNLHGRQRPTMKEAMLEIERIRSSRMPSIGESSKNQEHDGSTRSLVDYIGSLSDDSFPTI